MCKTVINFIISRHNLFRASLADLEIIITSGEEINPNAYADILNANLVYLCENRKNNSKDIVDCHGIGKKFFFKKKYFE